MKTILFFLALSSSQFSLACDGILYRYESVKPHTGCQEVAPETYCCQEGGHHGEYYDGVYYYYARSIGDSHRERVCTTRIVCSGGGTYVPQICGPQTSCQND